jgi:two-component system CheB/CheR fusion protein
VLDADLKVVSANRNFYQIFKTKPEETEGQVVYDIGNRQWNIPKLRELLEEILPKNTSFDNFEVEHDFPHIGKRIMILNARRICGEANKTEMILLAIEDITERKQAQAEAEVRKLLQQKDEFIGQLGHDLKTPLSILINMLPMIKEDEEKPETKENWDVVMRNIGYIKNLVSETLKIVELDSSEVTFEMNDTNLLDLVNNTIKDNKIVFDKNNIKIENMINEKITVNGDELRIKEVFCNLIINAVKFTPENGSILVDAKKDNDFVTISVKDTGMGLTQGQIEHIFDEFYKAMQPDMTWRTVA